MNARRSKLRKLLNRIIEIFFKRNEKQLHTPVKSIGGRLVQYPITEIRIVNPNEMFKILDTEMYPWNIGNQWLFRGQNDDSPLIPFAEREGIRPNNCTLHELREWEARLFDSFLKKAAYKNILPGYYFPKGLFQDSHTTIIRSDFNMDLLGDEFPETWRTDNIPLLGLAQHFGLPTSLMDWTKNRYNALLFANTNRDKRREYRTSFRVLWALNLNLWKRLSPQGYSANRFSVRFFPAPTMNDERIHSQEAYFGVHISLLKENDTFIPKSFEDRLEMFYQYYQENIGDIPETPFALKIRYPDSMHQDMRSELTKRGLTELNIYPDLNTAAKLAWKEVQ